MSEDPLDILFDTPEAIEGERRERLAKMLAPFVTIDPENGTIYTRQSWFNLNAKCKVLVFLLARLALSTRNPEFSKALSSKEVEEGTEMPGGTVRPKLSELVRDRIVFRNRDNQYFVKATSMSINNAWTLLEDQIPNSFAD